VHRIDGPIGIYRGTDNEVDRRIWEMNQRFADVTILQSRYSLEAHLSIDLHFRSPVVIPNAVDPAIFHPRGRLPRDPGRKIRLISTSWSDNPGKGAATCKWIEDHLDWNRFEFTFIGRSPIRFDRIRTLPPLPSQPLSDELRAHDIYVTASRNDACSNALLEGLACGLPALALRSGGNPELVAEGGVLFDGTDDVLDKLAELVANYESRQTLIRVAPLSEVVDRYLRVMLPESFAAGGQAGEAVLQPLAAAATVDRPVIPGTLP
jgi:glycosyltransferase involved in cell wall biosynthesis